MKSITFVQVANQYSGTAAVEVPEQASIPPAAAPPQARAAPLPDHLGILYIQAATSTPQGSSCPRPHAPVQAAACVAGLVLHHPQPQAAPPACAAGERQASLLQVAQQAQQAEQAVQNLQMERARLHQRLERVAEHAKVVHFWRVGGLYLHRDC